MTDWACTYTRAKRTRSTGCRCVDGRRKVSPVKQACSSGERALEGRPVEGAAVCLEQVFYRQREQRAQAIDDLLTAHAFDEPAGVDLRPVAEVGERIAGDDCAITLDPEHHVVALMSGEGLNSDGQ